MREGAARIESERRQDGENGIGVVTVGGGSFAMIEFRVVGDFDAVLRQFGQQQIAEAAVDGAGDFVDFLAHGRKLLADGLAVDAEVLAAGGQLLLEGGAADHGELVEIGADDGDEFDALQKFVSRVAGFFEDAPLELQQTEFAIEVELRIVEVHFRGRRGRDGDNDTGLCGPGLRFTSRGNWGHEDKKI